MTPLFIAAAIAAAAILRKQFLQQRRVEPRLDKEDAESVPATSAPVVVNIDIAPLEAPRVPEFSKPFTGKGRTAAATPAEEQPSALPSTGAAQVSGETNTALLQIEPAAFDVALPEENLPAGEPDETAAMPEEEQPAAHAAAAGAQTEAETSVLEVHTEN